MDKSTIRHELFHILGDAYGLYRHALNYNTSFKKLFDQAEVPLDLRGSVAAGTAGGCFMHIPNMPFEYQRTINAHGALAPALMDGDGPVMEAIRIRNINPLYGSMILSDQDRVGFDLAPLNLSTVVEAAIVAKEYVSLIGVGWHKLCEALDAATMNHDELPLSAIVNFDRFMVAVRYLPEQRNELYTEARHAD